MVIMAIIGRQLPCANSVTTFDFTNFDGFDEEMIFQEGFT